MIGTRAAAFTRPLVVLGTLLALGGCAGAGMEQGPAGANAITVEVENNLIPPTSLSVYAVPNVGARQLVGVVEPSRTKALSFELPTASAQYQFVAETTAGQDIVSNEVTLTPGDRVEWNVSANIATVRGG